MMNNGGQPTAGTWSYAGRRHPGMPYGASPQPSYGHQHHGYQQAQLQQHYQPQPPPQWAYYPNMQPGMPRSFAHQYQPMMNASYPLPHAGSPMSPRPNPPQPAPAMPSIGMQQPATSPMPPDQAFHLPTSASVSRPSPPPAPPPSTSKPPFHPPLPWYSVPVEEFPTTSLRRRKKKPLPQSPSLPVELPLRNDDSKVVGGDNFNLADGADSKIGGGGEKPAQQQTSINHWPSATPENPPLDVSMTPTLEVTSSETPNTSQPPSESGSTQPTTPSSAVQMGSIKTPTPRNTNKPIIPAVPCIPSLSHQSRKKSTSIVSDTSKRLESTTLENGSPSISEEPAAHEVKDAAPVSANAKSQPSIARPAPKSWADLVRSQGTTKATSSPQADGLKPTQPNGTGTNRMESLTEVLNKFSVRASESETKIHFLKPRGLVNTGNMCYMNSVLQILVFCVPFYDLFDQVSKHVAHSFSGATPMIDAMIMFIGEFPVIDSAISGEQLRMRLKDGELEEYGEAFTPEFVYEVIRRLPRFSSMRRGHQQDAEEFLGFLLEEMHEECVHIMKGMRPSSSPNGTFSNDLHQSTSEASLPDDQEWREVGPKQKPSITRSSGLVAAETPITKIFGGKLRSELRVPGAKNSVTLEPYQPLQLDIGSPQVNNITDALKGLTRLETLHGDFKSPRGLGATAKKQVFIETLPPVLILHLKRFQYDNAGGTQKIWKKIGYPLDLEIPKEVFPSHMSRNYLIHGGLPKYRLIGVVYHHGKSASGGHYTVDVRRQDGREWIRLDDTVIRRVRSEEVAACGSEEDPKVLAAALEKHKRDQSVISSNMYDQVREERDVAAESEKGWSHVNGSISHSKNRQAYSNGSGTPLSPGKMTPNRFSAKDNKVAYILFYQKIGS